MPALFLEFSASRVTFLLNSITFDMVQLNAKVNNS